MAGAIGSYTVMGTVVGAVVFGMLADKVGRKKVIVFSTVVFSLFTVLSGFANGPGLFIVFRIIAGLGLGGVMPNVIASMTEYAPRRVRTAMVSIVFTGYSLGAMAAALTSRSLLPEVGWKPLFWLAGIPLLFLPFIIKRIPESVGFLMEKGKVEEAKKILAKIDPSFVLPAGTELQRPPERIPGSSIVKLFEDKRALSTLMFWISCFSAFVLIYSMNTWLPRLLMQSGFDLDSSLLFTAVMQIGAIVGTIVFGRLVDKLGFKKVLVPLFFAGAIALGLLGFTRSTVIVFALIAIIGAASFGVQNMANAFVSQYYSADIRSTAIGSTMAFGRIGGIVAPTLIGFLLTMNLQPQFNFGAIGIAALIGGIAMLFVQEKHAHYNQPEEAHAEELSVEEERVKELTTLPTQFQVK